MKIISRSIEYLVVAVLLVVGILGAFIGVADQFGWDVTFFTPETPTSLILTIISLLAVGIGLERIGTFRRQENLIEELKHYITTLQSNTSKIETRLSMLQTGERLVGPQQIFNNMTRIAKKTKHSIRALILDNGERSPIELTIDVAKRLKELNNLGEPAYFDAVIAADTNSMAQETKDWIKSRHDTYVQYQIDHMVRLHILQMKPPFGFDVFIVDEEHTIILFTKLTGTDRATTAILFENQPEIARDFTDWFDRVALRLADALPPQ